MPRQLSRSSSCMMILKMPAPAADFSFDLRASCSCRHKTSPYTGLVHRCFRAPVLLRYGQFDLNDVNSTRCYSQKEEGSASLLTTQNRLPHQTSDSGAPSTSSESRSESMVGTLRNHSNNAVARTPPKAPRVCFPYLTMLNTTLPLPKPLRSVAHIRATHVAFSIPSNLYDIRDAEILSWRKSEFVLCLSWKHWGRRQCP